MGREKPNKPRRQRSPAEIAAAYASAYRCSDCHAVTTVSAVEGRTAVLDTVHEPGCPALDGVTDMWPDTLAAIGRVAS
ncbi:hypothetical protein [Streptomyces sp. NPDC020747]|uniref:hypothetical protein n=1 Tax=Streptomyces sp. NPDC020747 TaxID=3365086 RepID=UPI00379816B5